MPKQNYLWMWQRKCERACERFLQRQQFYAITQPCCPEPKAKDLLLIFCIARIVSSLSQ
jgi:hypothetical protein